MTRLIARLVLAMLILPLSGTVFVLFVAAFAARGGPPHPLALVGMWAGVYGFIGAYWVLLWRGLVRWTRQRVLYTVLAAPLALLLGTLTGLAFVGGVGMPAEPGMLVGGGVPPIAWVLATVLIWRETPQERIARLTAAGTENISCPVCGYNMTGLHESRCPECGAQFTLDELLQAQPHRDHGALPSE
jgi:hypothetical protein